MHMDITNMGISVSRCRRQQEKKWSLAVTNMVAIRVYLNPALLKQAPYVVEYFPASSSMVSFNLQNSSLGGLTLSAVVMGKGTSPPCGDTRQ